MNRRQFLGRVSALAGGILLPYFPGFARANYLYLPHRRKSFRVFSWDLLDEDCADLTGWTDDSSNDIVTVDPAGQYRYDASAAAIYERNYIDVGSFPNTITVEIKVYHDLLGTRADIDRFWCSFDQGSDNVSLSFATDGFFAYDGATFNEVGTNLVATTTWQTWRFLITFGSTMDVYLGGVSQATGVDISSSEGSTNGKVIIGTYGYTITTQTHMDYIKIGTGLKAP